MKKVAAVVCVILLWTLPLWAAYAQFYPIEIFINPVGVENQVPGSPSEDYSTFSALRISLNKDLPSNKKISNKFILSGSSQWYHQAGKERDFFPFYINPIVRSHFFLSDIVTAGIELNGHFESLYGIDLPDIAKYIDTVSVNGDLFSSGSVAAPPLRMLYNRRGRAIPFFYIALTPDLLMYNAFTFGNSAFTKETFSKLGMIKNDYNILKAESKFIYFSPIHIRFFIAPYVYKNNYLYRTARSAEGLEDINNPLLREEGFGSSFGARYSTFRWGYIEFQTELEKNIDKIFGSNNYKKVLVSLKLENQYFTERFGYIISADFTRHFFTNYVTSSDPSDSDTGRKADKVARVDVMPIINFSRNVSLRPQYDMTYKKDEDGSKKKHRFWLHLHFLW